MNLLLLRPGETLLPRSDERARHIEKILRLGCGDTLKAGVVNGMVGSATIVRISATAIELDLELSEYPPELAPVELLLGHPRPLVMKRLFRDLAAIGPASIHVVPTELGEKSYRESNIWDRTEEFLLDGASQGGTTRLPLLIRHDSLSAGIAALTSGASSRFVLHPGDPPSGVVASDSNGPHAPVPLLPHALADDMATPVTVAVGSERGWTPSELETLEQAGFLKAHLGSRILRTEAAALLAVWNAVVRA